MKTFLIQAIIFLTTLAVADSHHQAHRLNHAHFHTHERRVPQGQYGQFSGGSSPSTSSIASQTPTYTPPSGLLIPEVASVTFLGASTNNPSTQFVNEISPPCPSLPPSKLTPGIDPDLTDSYPLSNGTGNHIVSPDPTLGNLQYAPHLSRDGGKGGVVNGAKVFLFCDTGTYSPPSGYGDGEFTGFVSGSAAIDVGDNATSGTSISLQDGIGAWSDNAGRMRGLVPYTTGELGYNNAMQGADPVSYRYAIWPESAIIPLNSTHGLVYAPVVYDEVQRDTGNTTFTYTGTILLGISMPGDGGPVAERISNRIWQSWEVEWGTIGGARSWGSDGQGGNNGKVYLFGRTDGGLLLSRVDADKVSDRDSYEYWTEASFWSSSMQAPDSTAFFITGNFMTADLVYSPYHKTFLLIYQDKYMDNTIYYRFLQAPAPLSSSAGASADLVENIVKYDWSEQEVLLKAPAPGEDAIYAGGPLVGYFDDDDLSEGGMKMLITWTAPTGKTPGCPEGQYQHESAVVSWQ